jgi:3-phenylpropionate/cinnamic acid dioxygenase small subunit
MGVTTPETVRAAVADLLYREARLLDDNALQEWLDLFVREGLYCAPLGGRFRPGETSILADDDRLRRQRVYRLLATPAYAQRPPSRTVRQVGNIEVAPREDGTLEVECVVVIHEVRVGDERQFGLGVARQLPARCRYTLSVGAEGELRILRKEVVLLMREAPLENLSLML